MVNGRRRAYASDAKYISCTSLYNLVLLQLYINHIYYMKEKSEALSFGLIRLSQRTSSFFKLQSNRHSALFVIIPSQSLCTCSQLLVQELQLVIDMLEKLYLLLFTLAHAFVLLLLRVDHSPRPAWLYNAHVEIERVPLVPTMLEFNQAFAALVIPTTDAINQLLNTVYTSSAISVVNFKHQWQQRY